MRTVKFQMFKLVLEKAEEPDLTVFLIVNGKRMDIQIYRIPSPDIFTHM